MSPLHNLKSKKKLSQLLFVSYPDEYKYLSDLYKSLPERCFVGFTENGRELFKLKSKTKQLHRRIQTLISRTELPSYIKSGRKKHSYLTNAFEHRDGKNFLFIDIKSFYPSITSNKIKTNLIRDYNQSADVAEFLTNAVSIEQVKSLGKRALVTGSPLSQTFSFLINRRMFDKLNEVASTYKITMSVYVDDISFSSNATIPFSFISAVYSIVKSHGYEISRGKGKYYRGRKGMKAEVTGVKITKYGLFITDKRKEKIQAKVETLKTAPNKKTYESILAAILQAKLVNNKYEKYERLLKKSFDSLI